MEKIGAAGQTRTDTLLKARDFKSLVSAISPQRHLKERTYPTIGYALCQGEVWWSQRDSHSQPNPYKEFALKLSYETIGGP